MNGNDEVDIHNAKAQKREEGRRRARELSTRKNRVQDNISTRHGAKNQDRHKNFAKWILSTFPHVIDECGSASDNTDGSEPTRRHILDVAGGKGELSARLSLCHTLRVVMIDPRAADIASVYMNTIAPRLPNKWQVAIQERLANSPSFVEDELEKRFTQLVMPFTVPTNLLLPDKPSGDAFGERKMLFQKGMSPKLHTSVQNAALLIGLHSDGATEAIVDAALYYGKPFVVVPCCVFPNLFTNRYIYVSTEDEQTKQVPVRSHEQFCQYLLDKDKRFKREILPFEGRNVAIWWDGQQ